jgi:hypothetical protein
VIGVVMGGHGRSATLHVRAEQVRNLLSQLGYTFKREYHNEEQ